MPDGVERTVSEIPDKLFYKIGEICKYTDTQPYVLRFWESEFPQLARAGRRGGQRVYSRDELDLILKIKKLLYENEYTIAAVRELLEREEGAPRAAGAPELGEASQQEEGSFAAGPAPAERADSYKASYDLARQEIESLRLRLAETEERCSAAEDARDAARERCERVAARLEGLLESVTSRDKRARRARPGSA